MNHSKEQDYLTTIKKNHKVSTHIENKKGEHFSDSIFRHLRALKNVHRLSSIKILQSYSVAEHCYYTGLLFELVARHEGIVITREELYYVYRHDVVETITGDVLLPVKIHSKAIKNKWESIEETIVTEKYNYLSSFTDKELSTNFKTKTWNLFKACDLFELYLFILEEMRLGNRSEGIMAVCHNCADLLPEFKIDYITKMIK